MVSLGPGQVVHKIIDRQCKSIAVIDVLAHTPHINPGLVRVSEIIDALARESEAEVIY
jgi:hypothetical protein